MTIPTVIEIRRHGATRPTPGAPIAHCPACDAALYGGEPLARLDGRLAHVGCATLAGSRSLSQRAA